MKQALRSDIGAVLTAALPFAFAGFGVLELPVRIAESGPELSSSIEGLILASFALGYGAAQIPSGALTRRMGAVPVLRLAVIVCLVSWPTVLALQWEVVTAGRLVYGFAAGLTFSAGLLVLRERVTPARQAAAVASFATSWALAEACAALVGQSKLASGVFVGTLGVLAFWTFRFSPSDLGKRLASHHAGRREFRQLWTTGVQVMLIVTPAGLAGQIALTAWGPRAASVEADTSIVALGLLIASGIAVGSWIGLAVARSRHADAIVSASPFATGSLVAFFALAGGSGSLRLVAVFLAVTASTISFPPGSARIFRETPTRVQPLATAIINQAGWIASALAPAFLGLTAAGAQPPRGAWLTLAAIIVGAGVCATYVNITGNGKGMRSEAIS